MAKPCGENEYADARINCMSDLPDAERRWYAVYTSPCHEKRVAEHLGMRGVDHYLPLYRTHRRWKNRCKVELDLPLFPGYLFAHIAREERVRVLEAPGVVSMVGNGRLPTPLPTEEIESLRAGLQLRNAEPHPFLNVGEKARIRTGPLSGFEGVVLRNKNDVRLVLTIDLIMKSVAVEVDVADLEPLAYSLPLHHS
jgi:transcription antitermination factor NusG